MKNKLLKSAIVVMAISCLINPLNSQIRTVGLMYNDTAKAYNGYTLFAPKLYGSTYLINNEGRLLHKWSSRYSPGLSAYLLEDGHLLRPCSTKGPLHTGGGEGGRVEEYDWDGNMVWEFDLSNDTLMQHHDIRRLPNGNILMLVVQKKTIAQAIAAGFPASKLTGEITTNGMMLPDAVYEIQPTKPSGGIVVWEWHVWDHLIQDADATKSNFGVVASHPELIDITGTNKGLPMFWNHMNCIDYNPELDQILLSVRVNSEVWIIDHSTTTAEAKGHTGGKHGIGGDILYRWGNPLAYRAGTSVDQKLYQQHCSEWVKPGYPGAGNITVFDNGQGRNYSSIDEFTPPVDANGNYPLKTGSSFLPANLTWTYTATPATSMYAPDVSGAFREPNGNTLICVGTTGHFIEVTNAGEKVWEYVCPVAQGIGAITQGDTIPRDMNTSTGKGNSVFRVYRYPKDYVAFIGKALTPGDFIEKYSNTSLSELNDNQTMLLYPNPARDEITIQNTNNSVIKSISIVNIQGKIILSENLNNAVSIYKINTSDQAQGVYFIQVITENEIIRRKLIIN